MTSKLPFRLAAVAGVAASALVSGLAFGPASAQAPAMPSAAPVDYHDGAAWLCRPGRKDACAIDLSATSVAGSGKLTPVAYHAATSPKLDCFYVYPTVSRDPTPNSDMTAGPEEMSVIAQQFARFGSVCRTFAPLYRQVTLTALRAGIGGTPMKVDRDLGYNDVKAAWNDYLARDNGGRGVVLIGHSQGSGVLTRLVKEEIDGKPVQSRIASVILGGTSLPVTTGADVGGAFKSMPLCRRTGQTGCVVAFASFRSTSPPPGNSRFGKAPAGQTAACVNPAALAGGAAELHPFFAAAGESITQSSPAPVWAKGATVKTPFVTTPGLISAQCVNDASGSYLSVSVNADPADARTDEIQGDVITNGQIQKDWGLHLIDMNLTMGDMVRLVDAQSKAWKGR